MRVLVTGGAGFIGSHIVDALLARNHEVAVIDDLSTGRRENVAAAARFEECDIRDRAALHGLLAELRPEVVCHQAAQTSVAVSTREPVRDAEVNILGSIHLLDGCVENQVKRVVFASTGGAIYGEVPEGKRAQVGWMPAPISPYACAKLAVESYLAAYQHEKGLRASILRYANVYGPRQDPHGEAGVVAIFSQRLISGEPIRINAMDESGDDGCIRDYVFVRDVVAVNVEAIEGRVSDPIVNVATGHACSTRDVATGLASALDIKPEIGHGPRRAGDLRRSVLEPGAASGIPVDLGEGLRLTAEWFKQASNDR